LADVETHLALGEVGDGEASSVDRDALAETESVVPEVGREGDFEVTLVARRDGPYALNESGEHGLLWALTVPGLG